MALLFCATASLALSGQAADVAGDDANCAEESTLLQRARFRTQGGSATNLGVSQDPESSSYHLGLTASDYCSTESVSQDLCQQALQDLMDTPYIGMQVGSSENKPPGCSWHNNGEHNDEQSTFDGFYNTNPSGKNNGEYTPVCTGSAAEPVVAHLGIEDSDYCSTESVSIDRCLQAGRDLWEALGVEHSNPTLASGSSDIRPPGCSMRYNFRIFYNTNADGKNDGEYTPICTDAMIVPVAHLGVSASDYCSAGRVGIESCLHAGRDLLPEGVQADPLLSSSWDHVPPGCSMKHDNYQIRYNTNADGKNNGEYTPICNGTMTSPTAHLGIADSDYCSTENVRIESCLHAGRDLWEALGVEHSNPTLNSASWDYVPPGCSMRDNYRIFYNADADGKNNGEYTPICTEGAIIPVSAHLDTQALDHCSSASVSIESCLQAVRDLMPVGEEQAETTLQSGSDANKPPGCSMETETHTAHYNTNGGGHNNGDFTLVCADASSLGEELDALKAVVEDLEGEVEEQEAVNQEQAEQIDNLYWMYYYTNCHPNAPNGGC